MPRTRRRTAPWALPCLLIAACGGDGDGGVPPDGGTGTGGDPVALGPLPNPPLTEPPSADDEPLPDDAAFHTATDFAVVRERDALPPDPEAPTLTEADFAEGLPAPAIDAPPGLDPMANAAPAFDGLENVRVTAGETVEILFAPFDPDGGLPGMFPQALPEGASFDDNLDGTKTFRWQPLQADVGVNAFTVVAVDPEEPAYRTSQTVLIAVDAPADPASVPNVPPTLGEIPPWTVRAGDPVVLELAGVDRNGTVPTLELSDPPPGASFEPHPYREGVHVLKLVADAPGELAVEVLVRDGADPSLESVESVTFDVAARSAFARPGERLKDLAAARGVAFGFAASPSFYRRPDGALYADLASEEFALLTHESSLKMDALNPLPGRYEFADADNLVAFARAAGMAVRGHPLVWYRQLPDWVGRTSVAEREGHMREFIARVTGRYADDVDVWDVVNEPLAEDGTLRESVWSEGVGERYIDVAFAEARARDPDATLVLNEFDAGVDGPKRDGLLALLDRLLGRDVPLDAVGFQLHLFASFDQFDELAASFAEVAARGLDVHVTELDVSLTDETDEDDQAAVYERVVGLCLAEPRCRTIQTWGFTDRYSFRSLFEPLPLDADYRAKPAYGAIQRALGGG